MSTVSGLFTPSVPFFFFSNIFFPSKTAISTNGGVVQVVVFQNILLSSGIPKLQHGFIIRYDIKLRRTKIVIIIIIKKIKKKRFTRAVSVGIARINVGVVPIVQRGALIAYAKGSFGRNLDCR